MGKKTNLKSIRLSDEIFDYVSNFEGSGFNQKFENLVLFCMRREADLRREISLLEQERSKIYFQITAARQLQRQLQRTSYLIADVETQLGQISRLILDSGCTGD